jgi:hypothetical protein
MNTVLWIHPKYPEHHQNSADSGNSSGYFLHDLTLFAVFPDENHQRKNSSYNGDLTDLDADIEAHVR